MKKNLKESLTKMRYLAGLISESQLKEFYEEDKYFKNDNKFSTNNPESVSELYILLRSEGAKAKAFPVWIFKELSEDGYIEESEPGFFILNREGLAAFRNENKLQQYLVAADENVEATGLDEDDDKVSWFLNPNVEFGNVFSIETKRSFKVFKGGEPYLGNIIINSFKGEGGKADKQVNIEWTKEPDDEEILNALEEFLREKAQELK